MNVWGVELAVRCARMAAGFGTWGRAESGASPCRTCYVLPLGDRACAGGRPVWGVYVGFDWAAQSLSSRDYLDRPAHYANRRDRPACFVSFRRSHAAGGRGDERHRIHRDRGIPGGAGGVFYVYTMAAAWQSVRPGRYPAQISPGSGRSARDICV